MVLLSVSGGRSTQHTRGAATDSLTPHLPALPLSTVFIIVLCKGCAAVVTLDTQNAVMPPGGVNYPEISYKPGDRDQSFLLIARDCRL